VSATVSLPLRVGVRTLWRIKRQLVRVRVPLGVEAPPPLPGLPGGSDGYFITALPALAEARLRGEHPLLAAFVRQRYRRSYASLAGSYDDYLGRFSSKTRSTLKRKVRKFAELSGGRLDLRCYRTPDEMARFQAAARLVSEVTYQERFGAGLPDGDAALAEMRALAAQDAVRAWILFLHGEPVSYLYAPAEGDTLLYLYLGYDPEHAALSPGTVLQLEAMRELMAEDRFALFDFTEGESRHKEMFATGSAECLDLLLVRRTVPNLFAGAVLTGFDAAVALAKRALRRTPRR
jgi:CelD/BcsL family acetyltransferase involved in cellulose biosynthesis